MYLLLKIVFCKQEQVVLLMIGNNVGQYSPIRYIVTYRQYYSNAICKKPLHLSIFHFYLTQLYYILNHKVGVTLHKCKWLPLLI